MEEQTSGLYSPQNRWQTRAADAAAIAKGGVLCMDVASISGGTSGKGTTITDRQAVQGFCAIPSHANLRGFCGVADRAYVRYAFQRHLAEGAGQALVYNPTAATVTLAVGTMLVAVPGQNYLIPLFINPTGGGTTKTLLPGNGLCRAIVRKSTAITTLASALVEVWVFGNRAPAPGSWQAAFVAAGTDVPAAGYVMIAPGPGEILRAGFGVLTGGGAGTLAFDVLINATSIYSATPLIANDCTDPCHTLRTVDTAVATYLGTNGAFGTIDRTKTLFVQGDIITFTTTNTSSFVGTGVHLQVDYMLY